ncbi:UNVERIFIED_CONTAM: hypothetical protein K2H54_004075 [Gekko kuhli]
MASERPTAHSERALAENSQRFYHLFIPETNRREQANDCVKSSSSGEFCMIGFPLLFYPTLQSARLSCTTAQHIPSQITLPSDLKSRADVTLTSTKVEFLESQVCMSE